MLKRKILAFYDYGTGSVGIVVNARDEEEIRQKYPMLWIPKTKPSFITDELVSKMEKVNYQDIDNASNEWLQAIALEVANSSSLNKDSQI